MRPTNLIPLAVVLAGLPGCAGDRPDPAAAELRARLNAALALGEAPERDAALANVTREAALAGHADVVKTALGRMSDRPAMDAAAKSAALALLEAGMPAQANEVAGLIEDGPMREDVLSRLAKG
jgi:hypothetical protein